METRDGVIVLNKPTGMSSNLAVQIVKRTLHPSKIGHLGTLDPLGSGILLLSVNKATKLFQEYLNKNKTYRSVFLFGKETDTLDSEGQVIKTCDKVISLDEIKATAKKIVGEFEQMPPKYSAKKINGKNAYELARKGLEVDLKPRHISIYECEVIEQVAPNCFSVEIKCSSGTYIRSIVRDMAKSMSTCGTMVSIIRTICGDYSLKDACLLEDIRQNNFTFKEINKEIK